ncbi:50S ribosomal protein L6, chloroplastic [Sesamum angolense]|uniref:50S ribosomal protein L6, chloroplastic n=1 Tax=Sesamum angolense TaxID=2727404 RepID=A0AAE1T9G6_9LAMI|nr:50S ribosomal protein L6, chloroplastic [Sesamum angolense]
MGCPLPELPFSWGGKWTSFFSGFCTACRLVRKIVECKESRIGKQPITVPSNVTLTMDGQDVKVKGPLGELALTYPREIKLEKEESGALRVKKAVETRRANQMHGLFRTLTDNMVVGVSKGFEKRLQLVKVEETRIIVSGYDKSEIGQFAASIRKWRPPEPYKVVLLQ